MTECPSPTAQVDNGPPAQSPPSESQGAKPMVDRMHDPRPGPMQEKETPRTIVIGNGPVGLRTAQSLQRLGLPTLVLGDEIQDPYNRVRLTPLLAGDVQLGDVTFSDLPLNQAGFDMRLGHRVTHIDRTARRVVTADGASWPYDRLVLATGSRAFVPRIPGRTLDGVYRFRSADDASALLARSFSARRVAVIGGGLLGLEAARGMRKRMCKVTVIEHEGHLMPRQLDRDGGDLLAGRIEDLGVTVRSGIAVREIFGTHRVEGLTLADGSEIACDTVIICTGIRANTELARDAGLAFGRGVTTNAQMQTSDPDIFAVGECAEHAGRLYGLVGPGYAQAEVAARVIAGEPASFTVAEPVTKLKVIGAEVFSAGPIEQLQVQPNVKSHVFRDENGYRRIFVERGTLVGAIAVGAWDSAGRVQDAVAARALVYPWMLFRFRRTGTLWPDAEDDIHALPDAATLCNCTAVSCGQVRRAVKEGAGTIEQVGAQTGAGTVCGTCQPLIEALAGGTGAPRPAAFWKPVLGISSLAFAGAAYPLLAGTIPLPSSFDASSLRDWLWRDNIVKQWSGFILLALTLTAMAIGLRKRLRLFDRLGGFDGWRLVHNAIGLAALIGFAVHTGFNLGSGWNLALGVSFAATVLAGAMAGLAIGGDHELRARRIGSATRPARRLPTWAHVILLWPLPVLIVFHVLASYAY